MVANLIEELLKKKKLNVTDIRRHILLLLHKPGAALTQKEMEEALETSQGSVDRVTLYRTIKTLVQKKIIHPITIDANTVRYKLIGEFKSGDHPHFLCCQCNHVTCMPQLSIDDDMLPIGYSVRTSQIVVEGFCSNCNKSSK